MKYCEQERDQSSSHAFVLGGKCHSLGFGLTKKNIFGNPFAHQESQLCGDVQPMPQAA
jgi:hypothetical protein